MRLTNAISSRQYTGFTLPLKGLCALLPPLKGKCDENGAEQQNTVAKVSSVRSPIPHASQPIGPVMLEVCGTKYKKYKFYRIFADLMRLLVAPRHSRYYRFIGHGPNFHLSNAHTSSVQTSHWTTARFKHWNEKEQVTIAQGSNNQQGRCMRQYRT